MKFRKMLLNPLTMALLVFVFIFSISKEIYSPGNKAPCIIINPYRNIDFKNYRLAKANFHAHEGRNLNPDYKLPNVVSEYEKQNYDILCVSEHNVIYTEQNFIPNLFPWTDHGVRETSLFPVNGCEISHVDDTVSLFSYEYYSQEKDQADVLKKSGEVNAVTFLCHPARYKRDLDYYTEIYKKYKNVIGMEAFNWRNFDTKHMIVWDNVLTALMPGRPVWGLANDDSHMPSEVGFGWDLLLLKNEDITESAVRDALTDGQFYFAFRTGPDPVVPHINSITVSNSIITIDAADYSEISWISSNGRLVAEGNTINIPELLNSENPPEKYIRAILIGKDSGLCTQPFGLIVKNK